MTYTKVYEGYVERDYNLFVNEYKNNTSLELLYDYKHKVVVINDKSDIIVFNAVNINILDRLLNDLGDIEKKPSNLRMFKSNITGLEGIKIFQRVNKLVEQDFDFKVEVINILEELLETLEEYDSKTAREAATVIYSNYFDTREKKDASELLDAFTDIRVMAIGATMKLGYCPECTLKEVSNHINSRRGEIVDGKFIKSKKEEDVKQWLPVNFERCKRQ